MIYIDFDGTLVDLWPRYYEVFCQLSDIKDVSLEEYKAVKRRLKRDEMVAGELGCNLVPDYFSLKKQYLEEMDFLKMDQLYLPAEYLNSFPKGKCRILTKRRNVENFARQLKFLGIDIPYTVITSEETKADWIRANDNEQAGVIIGDSVVDLDAGVSNITPYMVDTGLNTKADFDTRGIRYKYFDDITKIDFDRMFDEER